jgi:hypothetical protein
MAVDQRVHQIESLIAEIARDAYERGRKDALDAIVRAATGQTGALDGSKPSQPKPPIQVIGELFLGRKRAPRGSVETVIRRALDRNPDGATLSQILDYRESDGERMIADSSIRGDLRRGNGTKYKEIGDRWFYANE